jgi:NAD(P)-dependent dehydrogenase (short-subunit alcohol dehydrogenase family)
VADTIRAAGGRAEVCAGSVTDPDHLAQAAELAQRTWGRLDVLVNNAGISPAYGRVERVDPAEFDETLEVNLGAVFRCCRAALPLLEKSEAASVVNISSMHSVAALERMAAYAASKAGLEMLSRTIALEWADRGIRVNCVAPGYIETDMTAVLQGSERHYQALLDRIPMGRFARPREIAGAVLFLAGDASAYMTGASLVIDGGWSAR